MQGTRKVAVEQGFHNHVLPAERTVMLQQEPNRVPRVEPMKTPPEARLRPNAVRHFYRPPNEVTCFNACLAVKLPMEWEGVPVLGSSSSTSGTELHLPLCTGP